MNSSTPSGRFPCWDCTLKHLGTAALCFNGNIEISIDECLQRAKIFLSEADNGYKDHMWLAAASLNLVENNLIGGLAHEVRQMRKRIMDGDLNVDIGRLIETFDGKCKIDCGRNVRDANILEAISECPDEEIMIEMVEWIIFSRDSNPPIMEWIFKISSKRHLFEKTNELL